MLEWLTRAMEEGGYVGIFLLMLLENVFPPIPSEVVMPLAGFAARRGDMGIMLVVVAGTLGSLAGALFWYGIGAWLGIPRLKRWTERQGHWLTMRPEDVDTASDWFNRHSGKAVFFGRLVPAVRTLISIPAGVSGMPLPRFLVFSLLGTTLWTSLLAAAGYLLGENHAKVEEWINPLSTVVVAALLVGYVWRVIAFRRASRRSARATN